MHKRNSTANTFNTDNAAGNMNSMDAIVVIKTTTLLSMEEAAQHAAGETNDASSREENNSESTKEGKRKGVVSSMSQSIYLFVAIFIIRIGPMTIQMKSMTLPFLVLMKDFHLKFGGVVNLSYSVPLHFSCKVINQEKILELALH